MPEMRSAFSRKVGPLPLYGWGVILVGATLGFLYLRRSRAGQSSLFGGTDTGSGSGGSGGTTYPETPLPVEPTPITPDDFCLVSGSDANGSYDCIANRKHYRTNDGSTPPVSPIEPDACTISGTDSIGPYECENGRKVRRAGTPITNPPGSDAEACIRAGGYWTKRGNIDGPGAWYCASEPLR